MPSPTLSADALRDLQALYDAAGLPWRRVKDAIMTSDDRFAIYAYATATCGREGEDYYACQDAKATSHLKLPQFAEAAIVDLLAALPALLSAAGEYLVMTAERDFWRSETARETEKSQGLAGEVENLRAENVILRSEVDCSEQELDDVRRGEGYDDLENEIARLREQAAALSASTLPRPASGPAEAVARKTLETDARGDAYVHLAWALTPGRPQIVAICTTPDIADRYRPAVERHHPGAVFHVERATVDHHFGARDVQSMIYRAAPPAAGSTEGE